MEEKQKLEGKILVVDDEPLMRELLTRIFSEKYSVDSASNGREALEKIEENGNYLAVITDKDMPLMDGVQFLKELEQKGCKYPVLFLSGGLISVEELRRAYSGPLSFMQKGGISIDKLLKEVENFSQ